MQNTLKHTQQLEANDGEVIAFYGDLTSINPEDVDFKGTIIKHNTVLAYVNEHKNNPHFTMMYPQANKSELFSGIAEQIREINPHTQFMQINSIEDFAHYW